MLGNSPGLAKMKPSVAFFISQCFLVSLVLLVARAVAQHDWSPATIAKTAAMGLLYAGYVLTLPRLEIETKPKGMAVLAILGGAILLVSTGLWQLLT